jgi:RNA polymerase sigma factor (sigma-70 family)
VPRSLRKFKEIRLCCETGCPAAGSGLDCAGWFANKYNCMYHLGSNIWRAEWRVLLARPGRLPELFPMKDVNDEQLMAQLQAGQADALTVLFDRYHRLVLGIALKIVRDRGEAEDVLHNVFLEIFRAAVQFDPAKGSTKTWLLQYAYHRSINRRQQLNYFRAYPTDQIDLAVSRRFGLTERVSLYFRVEYFNISNHPGRKTDGVRSGARRKHFGQATGTFTRILVPTFGRESILKVPFT